MFMSAHQPKSVCDNIETEGLKTVIKFKTIKHSPSHVSVRNED